jgi:hypothetical protein
MEGRLENVSTKTRNTARVNLGQTLITPGAQEALREAGQAPHEFLLRHEAGDWEELTEDDRNENELSLQHGFRLLSAYSTSKGQRIWIITEADRRATTILLPDEY